MALMRTSNPALNTKTFEVPSLGVQERMTIQGTINKSAILIFLLLASAYLSWQNTMPDGWSMNAQPVIPGWYLPVILGTFVLSLVLIFVKSAAPYLAPLYAVGEGVLLGTISALFEVRYPGIPFQAVLCTAMTFISLLLAYRSGWIRATENFKLGMFAAMGGIMLVYLIDFVLNLFHKSMPFLHDSGPMGIAISLVIVCVAALNLVLDFDFIEQGAERGAPKYMEWYAAFGLLVTLVWLYLEILRLLAKTRDRR